jgi:ribosomal subunit interface protein
MNIEITARNFTISDHLKEFTNDKLMKLSKYDSNISNISVIFLKESRAEKVELLVHSNNSQYIAKCYSSVFEKTLVNAISSIISQINKNKTKY